MFFYLPLQFVVFCVVASVLTTVVSVFGGVGGVGRQAAFWTTVASGLAAALGKL